MENNSSEPTKAGRRLDGAYGFSLSIGLGLILFIAGLIVSLTVGEGPTTGLIFGIPLLAAGLIVPLIMMRGGLKHHVISGECPYCQAAIKTSEATIRLNCPACSRKIVVRDLKLLPGE